MNICPYCNRSRNAKNKPFTKRGLSDHVVHMHPAEAYSDEADELKSEKYDHIDPEESDGVYWAMVHEAGGYF